MRATGEFARNVYQGAMDNAKVAYQSVTYNAKAFFIGTLIVGGLGVAAFFFPATTTVAGVVAIFVGSSAFNDKKGNK
ncbi:hypothetical protein D8827_06175 [Streptococcus intermedius]|uniref:Uncharacterized protein n=1 Tax=Streptococcus intermedius TaxID=1338 RepID=A0AAE8KBP1_STRIT|nr:hypothetical protein [Streptococcus intermedius]RSJ23241.1 hypothetical protein D8827_06175 [Streptococcus intermedius]